MPTMVVMPADHITSHLRTFARAGHLVVRTLPHSYQQFGALRVSCEGQRLVRACEPL
jgi:hypothetical protein